MNRTIRAIIGACLILVIMFSGISICQNIGKFWKVDITEQKLYTLSDGTKSILSKLNQPITAKLFYAKTAALKGPDQIKYFNNYYEFVKSLLEQYVAVSKGMIKLEVIDPRPFSDEEMEAIRFGLKQYRVSEEESFFFGLVVQTEFGVEKSIPFFSPDRQNFLEYDISYLIDTAVTRQKGRIGILSSLPIMGDDSYMAQMLQMQGQQPKPAWTIVEQLRKKYEVTGVPADTNDINDIDILLIIHPKDLPEQTLFAIDQFVLKGGRTIVCVDPHCFADRPAQASMQMNIQYAQNSDLNILMRTWGIEMPENQYAGDKNLAERRALSQTSRIEPIIGFLDLNRKECFNADKVITAELGEVRLLFSGVFKDISDVNDAQSSSIEKTPLIMTTNKGNSFSINSPYEFLALNPTNLMQRFVEGNKPVIMGYLITGRFQSSFPDGIEIEVNKSEDESSEESEDPNNTGVMKKKITGLTEAQEDCAVIVFSDVDFITDSIAYSSTIFGKIVVGDNSTLMLNSIDDLGGSSDLISIRSKGNFRRPFTVVDKIERQAEEETADEIANIDMAIAGYNTKLQSLVSSAQQGQEEIIGNEILQRRRELEKKIYESEREKRLIGMKKRERIDKLGRKLQRANTIAAPLVILIIAVVLGLRRSLRKRHYISHASDS